MVNTQQQSTVKAKKTNLEDILTTAKNNGVNAEEMAEILTHQAFYAGWPNVWAAFNSMKKAYVIGKE